MIKKGRWLIAVLVCALWAIPASCAGTPGLTESDQAHIYASVIRQLREDQRAQMPGYIMEYTNDNQPGGIPEGSDREILSESLKEAIPTALASAPGQYTWVSSFSEVPHDQYFSGATCQIILGSIRPQADGSVYVTASLFYGGTGGGGGTFVLKRENGVWTVTGMTGPIWIS